MRFSPNTLNTVIAVLSCENVPNLTPERLNAALQLLTGEQNTSPDLQPGETYLVYDKDNQEALDFTTREQLNEWLEEAVRKDTAGRGYTREVNDYASVSIIRRELNVQAQTFTKITIS